MRMKADGQLYYCRTDLLDFEKRSRLEEEETRLFQKVERCEYIAETA